MADALERLKILLNSSTPIVVMETVEEMRAVRLVRVACSSLNLATFEWSIASGLVRCGSDVGELVPETGLFGRPAPRVTIPRRRRPGTLQQQGTRPGAEQPGGDVARSGIRSQGLSSPHGRPGCGAPAARRGAEVFRQPAHRHHHRAFDHDSAGTGQPGRVPGTPAAGQTASAPDHRRDERAE